MSTTAPRPAQSAARLRSGGGVASLALLDLAPLMEGRPHGFVEALRGDTLVCFFEKAFTRTRVSFAAAA